MAQLSLCRQVYTTDAWSLKVSIPPVQKRRRFILAVILFSRHDSSSDLCRIFSPTRTMSKCAEAPVFIVLPTWYAQTAEWASRGIISLLSPTPLSHTHTTLPFPGEDKRKHLPLPPPPLSAFSAYSTLSPSPPLLIPGIYSYRHAAGALGKSTLSHEEKEEGCMMCLLESFSALPYHIHPFRLIQRAFVPVFSFSHPHCQFHQTGLTA